MTNLNWAGKQGLACRGWHAGRSPPKLTWLQMMPAHWKDPVQDLIGAALFRLCAGSASAYVLHACMRNQRTCALPTVAGHLSLDPLFAMDCLATLTG